MLMTALLAVLAANEVQDTAESRPQWGVQLSLASPSMVGFSFNLTPPSTIPGLAALGSVTRPGFTNAVAVERAFSEAFTGVAAGTFGFVDFGNNSTQTSGGGLVGARWYLTRAFDGLWVGPEVLFQVTTSQGGLSALAASGMRHYAAGVRGRMGWTQRFGSHFVASATAGLGTNVAWSTAPIASVTLNLGLDVGLSAGLVF